MGFGGGGFNCYGGGRRGICRHGWESLLNSLHQCGLMIAQGDGGVCGCAP
jgi:hypothetical protein